MVSVILSKGLQLPMFVFITKVMEIAGDKRITPQSPLWMFKFPYFFKALRGLLVHVGFKAEVQSLFLTLETAVEKAIFRLSFSLLFQLSQFFSD